MVKKVTPFLWFDANAEEAAEFYLSVFRDGRKLDELRVGEAGPGPEGSLLTISIEPYQTVTDAFSFVVRCESQAEIDGYWAKLTEGGSETACGWLRDKFGLAWQIVPETLPELVRHPGAMKAMMGMVKLDIAALEAAAKA
jgi:predicted 3-demethylubiquinone-9 3-methyltransferase (glyoxalase superfamily)